MNDLKKAIKRHLPPWIWLRLAAVSHFINLVSTEPAWQLEPKARHSRTLLRTLHGKHQGERCFIIGNGPSLRKMDLSPLRDEYTFGLNRIYLLFDDMNFIPSYYVSVNKYVIDQCAQDIAAIPSTKFIAWRSRDVLPLTDQTIFLRSLKHPHFSTNLLHGVWEGATVTYVSMQVAYYLGFSQVILIGVDHSFKTKGEAHKLVVSQGDDPDHFAANYFGKGFRWQLPDLATSEAAYGLAKRQFEKDGREIVDATIGGQLQVFRKVTFSNLFQSSQSE